MTWNEVSAALKSFAGADLDAPLNHLEDSLPRQTVKPHL